MPIVWVPFDPDTGRIKVDANNNSTGYALGYVSELGSASDFPDASIVNDMIMPTFIPKFEVETVRNLDYDAITTSTSQTTYTWVEPFTPEAEAWGEYGWKANTSTGSSNTNVNSDINVDNRDKALQEIKSWVINKYETILAKIEGFFIITERELVNNNSSSTTKTGIPTGVGATGQTQSGTTTSTVTTKQKEILKGLRKLPTQIIKCKIRL